MNRKTVLVTGATGFVGQYVCRKLADRKRVIVGVLRPNHEPPVELKGIVDDWLEWDMGRDKFGAIPAGVSSIIHLAQSHRFRDFPSGSRDLFEVNVGSMFALLEAARDAGVSQFVYASSGGVYGQGAEHATEDQPIHADSNLDFYLTSKLIGEMLVRNYRRFFSSAVLRIFFAYGPGQQEDRLVMRLITNVAEGKPISLSGENGLMINPIYVTDAAEAVVRALDADRSQVLNVAGKEVVSLRDLSQMIGEVVGKVPVYDNKSAVASSLVGDPRLMCTSLQFSPSVKLSDGLRATAIELFARTRS